MYNFYVYVYNNFINFNFSEISFTLLNNFLIKNNSKKNKHCIISLCKKLDFPHSNHS